MFAAGLVSVFNLHTQGHPCVSHEITMISMGGSSGLLGVVPFDRSLLGTIQWLYRAVVLKTPGRKGKHRMGAVSQMGIYPGKSVDSGDPGRPCMNKNKKNNTFHSHDF